MKRLILPSALFIAAIVVPVLRAQDFPQLPAPQKEHEWLKQFVGEWESESEGSFGPDQPTMKCKGAMKARMLGGFWMVADVQSDAMGMSSNALLTVGYDTKSKKYVGTWVDSMFNHLWKYEGSVDPAGKILTLEAEGPNFLLGGKLTKFRDVYEFKSKDLITISSSMQGDDGKWVQFMKGTAKRKANK